MYEDPEESPAEAPRTPEARAQEKSDEFRLHAERAAVYEGPRKFDAELIPLDASLARDLQKSIARLEKAKTPESPILPPESVADAAALLDFPAAHQLSTNDYHVYRRPGEVFVVRWLQGDEVETFYTRFQAHFDAALNHFKEDERQSLEWKKDPGTSAYLAAVDAIEVNLAERYLRDPIRQHKLFVLSTQTADEIDIIHLADYLMGVTPAELVGAASAPPDDPTEQDRAWFFKLFSLRGIREGTEQMFFFTYLQKAEETFSLDD